MAETSQPTIDIDISVPLIVDLDGTLVLTDTLSETLTGCVFSNPFAAISCLKTILNGRAAFKRRLTDHRIPDAGCLPHRVELIQLLEKERDRGREIHLVTAADQRIADEVANKVGVFDSATGSDGKLNLSGKSKLEALQRRFTDGFIYAGDSAVDLPIFSAARGVILCDASSRTEASAAKAGARILAELRTERSLFRTWIDALRVHQWSKTCLLFVPLLVGHVFHDLEKIILAALAFILLSSVTSATYLVNDLADLDADRLHATKRNRPFASGRLPITFGLIAAPMLIISSLLSALLLSPQFAELLFAYLVLTLAYSFGLKRIALVDVLVIGFLFTLRIAMGAAVVGLVQSPWLLSFALFFFVSLAFAKRHGGVMYAVQRQDAPDLNRGYVADDWPLTLTFGVGTGLVSIVVMLLYLANDAAPSGFYQAVQWLYGIPILISVWLMRIWLFSHRMKLHHDPVIFALTDGASLCLGIGVGIFFMLAL
jgi:4-hydroxybenzoate polyprenyltransferase